MVLKRDDIEQEEAGNNVDEKRNDYVDYTDINNHDKDGDNDDSDDERSERNRTKKENNSTQ